MLGSNMANFHIL